MGNPHDGPLPVLSLPTPPPKSVPKSIQSIYFEIPSKSTTLAQTSKANRCKTRVPIPLSFFHSFFPCTIHWQRSIHRRSVCTAAARRNSQQKHPSFHPIFSINVNLLRDSELGDCSGRYARNGALVTRRSGWYLAGSWALLAYIPVEFIFLSVLY